MIGPAAGEPDTGRAAPSRTGFVETAGGILVLLALGLALRLIIAYLLPGSGFAVDLGSFRFWANNLADEGLYGFYDRPFFHDYTPGYLYVLWLVGGVANLFPGGGVGDLIKVPPIVADLALGYLVWSMVRELGGSGRAALVGAALVLFNPVMWFDSVVWGQVDSFGVVFLLLSLRELWRDRPERAAILATVAALIKPQLGILIPLVAIVVIRRALWPQGGHGAEDGPEPGRTTLGIERRFRGPIRILTTGAAGFLTALVACIPFGLQFPFGLIAQIFKTAGGYPYLTVNAFNPWALYVHTTVDGREESLALNRSWICDATITPSGPSEFRIGPFVIPELSSPGSDLSCPDGVMIGAFPAVLVGAVLFLIAAVLVCWFVARRPDRLTMTVGLAILALAFFMLPTRVHERYLFPLMAIAAIPAAVSLRWRVAYLLSAGSMFANMYVILVHFYPDNPQIRDWLGIGPMLAEPWWIAIAVALQTAVFFWVFLQLREEAVEGLAESVATNGRSTEPRSGDDRDLGFDLDLDLPPPAVEGVPGEADGAPAAWLPDATASRRLPRWAEAIATSSIAGAVRGRAVGTVTPVWNAERDTDAFGPIAWLRARLADTPVRADRSRELDREAGGRLDRLDVWILAVLAISLLTVRMWRLDEPYEMHFDEVYHPRTAVEFLQDWRYGLPHSIYEWTHPHMAKYAMALGLVAFGEDRVSGTSDLGVAVVDAALEGRRDSGLDQTRVEGDRLWVATGDEVRAWDLRTREPAAAIPLPGAVALAYDDREHLLYVGTRSGEIRVIDTEELDPLRGRGLAMPETRAFMSIDGELDRLFISRDGDRLLATLLPDGSAADPLATRVVVIDAGAALELARPALQGVHQVAAGNDGRLFVATRDGVAVIDPETGEVTDTLDVGGPAMGVVATADLNDDPIYATVASPGGPVLVPIIAKADTAPEVRQPFPLPGDTAGRAYYDLASRMVHVEGTAPEGRPDAGAPVIYVIEPHANAVYADAPLPWAASVIVLDDQQRYMSSDRQQLLAFDQGGRIATVEIGRHAYAWRVPGVIAGVLMALLLYVLARMLFRRRAVAVLAGLIALVDGMLFVQSRIGMNDAYVGLGIVGAYTIFAALWLHPGTSRRHWLAFALGVPIVGLFLGFALASKWVAAFAIGGLGLLVLSRSALGRVLLIAGLVVLTTALGYIAISVPEGETGGNYLFLGIMVALVIAAVIINVVHPVAWTWEETRAAVGAPAAAGSAVLLYGLARGDAAGTIKLGGLAFTPIEIGLLGLVAAAGVWVAFLVIGRFGFGPLAPLPAPDDPAAIVDPPADPPPGWLNLGSGFGLPAIWLGVGLLAIPLGIYVLSYVPWAFVDNYQLWEGFPAGHENGQTLLELTGAMYNYHNNLTSPHAASSPWWAWTLDLKPVWFYAESFAGGTTAAIYDAGNLVAWWLGVPAMIFVAWQAFRRRSLALALIVIGFAAQWLQWARIDRAAFQYHYYTALPFLVLALAYFLAELWHGASRRTWLFARLAAAGAVLLPFAMWLLHRPLCAIAGVESVRPGSRACPTLIPEVEVSPRAVALAIIMGVGVLLLLRELLAVTEEDEPAELRDELEARGWRGALARIGLGGRWATAAVIAVGTIGASLLTNLLLVDVEGFPIEGIPVEPIALVGLLALSPVAAYVATARDARRFVGGAIAAMVFWFVLWYPNISGLPLPADQHNAYQGFLPTYIYDFQFAVNNKAAAAPALLAPGPAIMLVSLAFMAIVVGYSAWSWRVALAERRRDLLAAQAAARREPPTYAMGAD
ncbi:MAG TPA: phospholipid carrier-dependent glycosyltransferase [Candidatus Binatia bacterium]|nr:phospholipid carrier-dependent glycosyltransferase [Candidatus Binatia bacterium]